jgi:hypothetical protein
MDLALSFLAIGKESSHNTRQTIGEYYSNHIPSWEGEAAWQGGFLYRTRMLS